MQGIIVDTIAIVVAGLLVAGGAAALIMFKPWKRGHRHRKRHSRRPRIDLFETQPAERGAKPDA